MSGPRRRASTPPLTRTGSGRKGIDRLTKEPLKIEGGEVRVPDKAGLGIELDFDRIEAAHQLYLEKGLGGRDDAIGMQYLIPGWQFDNKKPALVR